MKGLVRPAPSDCMTADLREQPECLRMVPARSEPGVRGRDLLRPFGYKPLSYRRFDAAAVFKSKVEQPIIRNIRETSFFPRTAALSPLNGWAFAEVRPRAIHFLCAFHPASAAVALRPQFHTLTTIAVCHGPVRVFPCDCLEILCRTRLGCNPSGFSNPGAVD